MAARHRLLVRGCGIRSINWMGRHWVVGDGSGYATPGGSIPLPMPFTISYGAPGVVRTRRRDLRRSGLGHTAYSAMRRRLQSTSALRTDSIAYWRSGSTGNLISMEGAGPRRARVQTAKRKENNMSTIPFLEIEITELGERRVVRPPKPLNTRTRKTAWKERRRLANAPKSIQKRVLKRK